MDIDAKGYPLKECCSDVSCCLPMFNSLEADKISMASYNDKNAIGIVVNDLMHIFNLCPWCGFDLKKIPTYIQISDYKVFLIGSH